MSNLIHLEKFKESPLAVKARIMSAHAHDSIGQKRKYTGLPYWTHTEAVADLVAQYTNNIDLICAAHLHDAIEDVPGWNVERVEKHFNKEIAELVWELTDVYTHKDYPKLNRATRKVMEHTRLGVISNHGKLIKLADVCNNSEDIKKNDPKFAKIYCEEMRDLLDMLKPSKYIFGNSELYSIANKILNEK